MDIYYHIYIRGCMTASIVVVIRPFLCSANLKFKFKFQLSRAGITCITFVSGAHGNAPMLLVNTSDSNINIIDCTYGRGMGCGVVVVVMMLV